MDTRKLNDGQWRTLRALVDCLIPADDFPSGWQAGVGHYLAKQFERDLRDQVDFYRAGLDALEAESFASNGTHFAKLSLGVQTHLLTQLEQGQTHSAWPMDASSFLNTVMNHAAEGFYSDPGNGGNQNGVAWRMVGYEVRG